MEESILTSKIIGIVVSVIVLCAVLVPITSGLSEDDGDSGGGGKLVFTTSDFTSINTEGMEDGQEIFAVLGKVTSDIGDSIIEESEGVTVTLTNLNGSLVPYWFVSNGAMSGGLYNGYIVDQPLENPPTYIWDITVEVDEGAKTAKVSFKTNMVDLPLDEITPESITISEVYYDEEYSIPFEFTYDSNVISPSSSDFSNGSSSDNTTFDTILTIIPVFVAIAIILATVGLLYTGRKND